VAWADYPDDEIFNRPLTLSAMCINADGDDIWQQPVEIVNTTENDNTFTEFNGIKTEGGVIYYWLQGYHEGNNIQYQQKCQKMDLSGQKLWNNRDALTLLPSKGWNASAVTDGNGGLIYAANGILVHHVNGEGVFGTVLEGVGNGQESPVIPTYSLILYPQPTTNSIQIEIPFLSQTQTILYQVTDLSGRNLKSDRLKVNDPKSFSINLTGISSGTYILTVETRQGLVQKPFVVLR